MQLQMADQSIRFSEGIVKDIMVNIQDHYASADFMILDMEKEDDLPIILGRPFLNTTNAVIYIGFGQIHFQFPEERYTVTLIVILLMSGRKRPTLGGDVDHPIDKPALRITSTTNHVNIQLGGGAFPMYLAKYFFPFSILLFLSVLYFC
jgi:hypothetical protein